MKWAGGKTRLLPELLARLPARYGALYEPFAGGAALTLALLSRSPGASQRFVVGDANADLIAMYRALVADAEAVIALLDLYQRDHSKSQFYGARRLFNDDVLLPVQRAAAFLYLNRACFNGLWRVNRAGAFNVPIGSYKSVAFDLDNIRAAALAFSRAELRTGDYRATVQDASAGDVVYFDPPYDDTFGAYTRERFDQRALADTVRELADRGCHVLVSNSDTPLICELYAGFVVERVTGSTSIRADGAGRGDVTELLITASREHSKKGKREVIDSRMRQTASILCADPASVSVKRLAWAFGCSKKDSAEEAALYRALVEKVLESRHAKEQL